MLLYLMSFQGTFRSLSLVKNLPLLENINTGPLILTIWYEAFPSVHLYTTGVTPTKHKFFANFGQVGLLLRIDA